jgi:hypothetical protein
MHYDQNRVRLTLFSLAVVALGASGPWVRQAAGQTNPEITVTSSFPSELNPPFSPGPPASGGAPAATPAQAAAFAWREFIAANWPAGPQQSQRGQRDAPSSTYKFGDPNYSGPLVWETFRSKVEIFPGNVSPFSVVGPPGYPGSAGDPSYGYDVVPPVYNYVRPVLPCDPSQANDATPWINLDETDQITLNNMYAGVVDPNSSPGNSSPQLIRFLAKANRNQYIYVAANSSNSDPSKLWWASIPRSVVDATKAYLEANKASPPASSSTLVSLPYGTIEAKAAWRPLNPSEISSGHFHTQTVRFYEPSSNAFPYCYRDAVWGLVALHIIQKTPSAPYFIYATFEQTDNLLTSSGEPVEDADGTITARPPPATATTPQVCLYDPQPPASPPPAQEATSALGRVFITTNPSTCLPASADTYCSAPGNQLYLRNVAVPPPDSRNSEPSGGFICIGKRENAIPDYVVEANRQAHAAIGDYLTLNNIRSAPWLFYKLINVQYYPYDKVITTVTPNGSLYTASPPYSATHPAPSSFYQANIVVETNRSLQLFSGGLSPNISTDWNADGSPHKNTYYGNHFYNMGGCMGCHGSQGQNPLLPPGAGDFSVILARGTVSHPEVPALDTSKGLTEVKRNRILSR